MPLTIPNLDDRRHAQLVTLLRDQIPGLTPEWTDFNAPDPGMTLVELWCWLAELLLYRINQVTPRTTTNFLRLVLDPPEPVTAPATIVYEPPAVPGPFVLPPGTLFTVQAGSPPDLEFETFQPTTLAVLAGAGGSPPDLSPAEPRRAQFQVRSRVVRTTNRVIGLSDGEPDQEFALASEPILVDVLNTGTAAPGSSAAPPYNPNPVIEVDGIPWQFVRDFLSGSGPLSSDFMVDPITRTVRFGDGVRGRIPRRGAEIRLVQYQAVLGREVRIGRDQLDLLSTVPGLLVLDVLNEPAEGGDFLYPVEELGSTGLRRFSEEHRAITEADFEFLATIKFNELRESVPDPAGPADRVSRAVVVPGKRLGGPPPFPDEAGAVSVIILPEPAGSEVELSPGDELRGRVRRLLQRRALVTTRVHVVGPTYVPTALSIAVVARPQTDAAVLQAAIAARVLQFFHPLTGGDRGNGWPIGRSLFKSEVFQLTESVAGVDHVASVSIDGNPGLTRRAFLETEIPLVTVAVTIA